MCLDRDPASSCTNLAPLPLGTLLIAGPLLKQPSLAVHQRIELFDVASQLRNHSAELGIEERRPSGDGLVTVTKVNHFCQPNVNGGDCLRGDWAWLKPLGHLLTSPA